MSPLIRFCIAVCICFFALGQTWATPRTVGYFCANCLDFDSAQQQAMQYAAPLECNTDDGFIDPDLELICGSEDRRVILGNHLTGQVFAFVVSRGNELPWPTTADAVSLNATETQVYETILNLRVDWENALEGGMTMPPEQSPQNGDDSCPSGTALDFLTRQGGQEQIENMITGVVSSNIDAYRDQQPWYSNFGVGVTIRGTGGRLRFPDGVDEGQSRYFVEFPISEVETPPFPDVLVYNLELQGVGGSGIAILDIEFVPESSRAAGSRLSQLFSANVEITNDCVLEKLGRLDDIGGNELRLGQGSGGGGALDPNNTFAPGGSSGGSSGGGASQSCVFDFFANGRYQYSFRAPCNSVRPNEEVDG